MASASDVLVAVLAVLAVSDSPVADDDDDAAAAAVFRLRDGTEDDDGVKDDDDDDDDDDDEDSCKTSSENGLIKGVGDAAVDASALIRTDVSRSANNGSTRTRAAYSTSAQPATLVTT